MAKLDGNGKLLGTVVLVGVILPVLNPKAVVAEAETPLQLTLIPVRLTLQPLLLAGMGML